MERKRVTEFVQIISPNSAIQPFDTTKYDGVFCKCGAVLIFDKDEEDESYIVHCPLCGFKIMYN